MELNLRDTLRLLPKGASPPLDSPDASPVSRLPPPCLFQERGQGGGRNSRTATCSIITVIDNTLGRDYYHRLAEAAAFAVA